MLRVSAKERHAATVRELELPVAWSARAASLAGSARHGLADRLLPPAPGAGPSRVA
jgi:hypothetical protein